MNYSSYVAKILYLRLCEVHKSHGLRLNPLFQQTSLKNHLRVYLSLEVENSNISKFKCPRVLYLSINSLV